MNSVVSANPKPLTGTGVGGRQFYQHRKGDKKHKGATLTLPSREAGWLALSLGMLFNPTQLQTNKIRNE